MQIGDKGKLVYQNGGVYDGFFKDGLRHGFGTFTEENGNKYEGRWENDQQQGEGKQFLEFKKEFYEGNFIIGKRDGFGKRVNHKGELYIGQWRNGSQVESVRFHQKIPVSQYQSLIEKFLYKKSVTEMEVKIFQ